MPRDFLPAIHVADGTQYAQASFPPNLLNAVPIILEDGSIGSHPRDEFTPAAVPNTPNASTNRGRGLVAFGGEFDLYLDEDSYFYDGGSQDLTATTGNGYAGNTGFNEEYLGSFTEHRVSGVANLVIVNAGHTSTNASAKHGNVWYQATAAAAPASISDADMPGNNGVSLVRGGASLDGYFFVCDITGKIHNSDLNDITAWTSTNFLTAEREPDIGVYLGKMGDNLVYIGTRSIEFFYNAGNATGSPLARRQDISYRLGCYHPNTIVQLGDIIFFLGTTQTGESHVYKLENFQLSIISNNRVDSTIVGGSALNYPDITALDSLTDNCYLSPTNLNNSDGLILTILASVTFYWHGKTGVWCTWEYGATVTYPGGLSGWNSTFPVVAHNQTSGNQRYQFTNGHIASISNLDNDAINDLNASNAPDVLTVFLRWDGGTDKKKRVTKVSVLTENYATNSASLDPANVEFRWAKYDRKTTSGLLFPSDYNAGRTIDLNIKNTFLSRLGTGREWSFLIHHTTGHGPVGVVKGLEIEYDIVE